MSFLKQQSRFGGQNELQKHVMYELKKNNQKHQIHNSFDFRV